MSVVLFVSLICTTFAEGSSLINREQILETSQLCPDVQNMRKGRQVGGADYPGQSEFYLMHPIAKNDPCIFETEDSSNSQSTIVLIRAIHVDHSQWDYAGSQPCTEHINLQLSNTEDSGALPHPLCSVSKPQNTSQDPHYQPMMWELAKRKMGISFSILANDSIIIDDKPVNLFPVQEKSQHQFIQIIFTVFWGEECSMRVQQYLMNPGNDQCSTISAPNNFYTVCGVYNCSEEKTILGKVGFWDESLKHEDIVKLIEPFRTKHYSAGSRFIEFVVGLLQLLILPISILLLFVCAMCLARRFKEKNASRIMNQGRRPTILHSQNDINAVA